MNPVSSCEFRSKEQGQEFTNGTESELIADWRKTVQCEQAYSLFQPGNLDFSTLPRQHGLNPQSHSQIEQEQVEWIFSKAGLLKTESDWQSLRKFYELSQIAIREDSRDLNEELFDLFYESLDKGHRAAIVMNSVNDSSMLEGKYVTTLRRICSGIINFDHIARWIVAHHDENGN